MVLLLYHAVGCVLSADYSKKIFNRNESYPTYHDLPKKQAW